MRTRLTPRTALAALSTLLAVTSVLWPTWIEALGVDPDRGSGAAEVVVTALVFAAAVVLGLAASRDWRRRRTVARPTEFPAPRP
jgi:hypothetical protein